MLNEFKSFIARGNVMDMAVGIIIGAAFTGIVTSLVQDLINPVIGVVVGGIDFSDMALHLTAGADGAVLYYGRFLTALLNFLIVAWVVFLLVKGVNRIRDAALGPKVAEEKVPSETELLIEIRDALRARG